MTEPALARSLADGYDCFLIDLDGVLYRGDRPIPGAPEAVGRLRAAGKRVVFVTNNSSRTPGQIGEKLGGMGIRADPAEIATSAVATASLLAQWGGGRAYVIGEDGIRTALAEAGIEVVDGAAEAADFVVVGWDRSADYSKLRTAALLVQRGARLVATNADPSYPAPDGLWPGAGALLAAITTTTGRPPTAVVGKPHAPLLRGALEAAGGGRPLVVGDRLDTDVAAAAGLGWDSLLVFSGVATPADLMRAADLPAFVGPDITALEGPARPVRPATRADLPAIAALLEACGLDPEGAEERLAETFVLETISGDADASGAHGGDGHSGVDGTVALELFGQTAHLRSLAVATGARGSDAGALLAAHAVRLARSRGAKELFAVTEEASGFFERLGFEPIGGKDALPAPIAATPMVAERCSASSVALRMDLPPPASG